jgi:hypothetical protein
MFDYGSAMFARGLLVELVAVLALGVASAGASGTPTITVGPGDSMTIQGSDISCAVSTTAPRAIVCGITGGQKSLRPNSYAVTVADRGAAEFIATGSQQIVGRGVNPAISGAPFNGSSHKPTSYVLAKHEHVILAGTHVACGSLQIDDKQTFGCGIYNTSSGVAGYYVAGTYATTLSDQFAGILRAGKNGVQTLLADYKQP